MRVYRIIILFCVVFFHSNSGMGQLTNGLLVNYTFGNNYEDSTPNGFDATPFGTNFVDDRFGNTNSAIYFDGLTSYVEFANDALLKPDFPLSMSLWINPERLENSQTNGFGIVANCFVNDNYHGALIAIPNNGEKAITVSYGDGTGCTGPNCRRSEYANTTSLNENRWYHLVAIYNSPTDLRIYLNGCQLPTTPSGSGNLEIVYNGNPGVLGKVDVNSFSGVPDAYFQGIMDDFYMWDRAITEAEITELYDFEAGPLVEFTASTDSVTCNIEEVDLNIQAEDDYDFTLDGAPFDLDTVTTLTAGSYTIVATNMSGCTANQILEVPYDTITPIVEINIGNITCLNPSAQLSASPHPDITSFNWWSVSGANIGSGPNAQIDQTGSYFMTAVSSNGCTRRYNFDVIEDTEEPVFEVSATEITCSGPAFVSASQDNPDYIIEWTESGILVSDAFSFSTDLEGTYIATVIDSTNGCQDIMSVEVIGNVIPIIGVEFDLFQECDEQMAVFNFNNVIGGVGPYTLSTTAIEIGGDQFFEIGQNNIQVIDVQGCEYDTMFIVEEISGINSVNIDLLNDCDQEMQYINDLAIIGGTAPYDIEHSGVTIDGQIYFSSGDQFVTIVDSNQCLFTEEFEVELVNVTNSIEFIWREYECGDTVQYLDAVLDNSNDDVLFFNGTSGELTSMGLPILFSPGEHFYSARTATGQCVYDTNFVVELPTIIQDVTYSLSQGCETGQAEFIINNIIGGMGPFTTEALTGSAVGDSYFFEAGNHSILVFDNSGCPFEIAIEVSPVSALELEAIPDMAIDWPELVSLEILSNRDSSALVNIVWSGYDGLSCSNCITTQLQPDRDVTIIYSVQDTFGCFREQEVFISIEKNTDIFTPNIFSPNNDGQNDFFTLFPRDEIAASIGVFTIFDRWGNLVFDAGENIEPYSFKGWDGRMNDADLVPGVYVYYYEVELVNGEIVSKRGDLTLVR